jgi:hypothetical protein
VLWPVTASYQYPKIKIVQITYKLKQRDFFESFIAMRNRKTWMKWGFRFIVVALAFLVTWRLVWGMRHSGDQTTSDLLIPLVLLAVWVFMMWGSPWSLARSHFSKQPSAQEQRKAILDSSGIQWRWDGGSTTTEWRTYIHWTETKNDILLFTSPIQCGIIPKRDLQTEQLAELRTLLTNNIGRMMDGW